MVVGKNFNVVIQATENKLTGNYIGNSPVVKYHMHNTIIFDDMIVRSDKACVGVVGQSRNFVGSCADADRPNGFAGISYTLDLLEI